MSEDSATPGPTPDTGKPAPRPPPQAPRIPAPNHEQARASQITGPVNPTVSEIPRSSHPHLPRRMMILLGLALTAIATFILAIAFYPHRPSLINPTPYIIFIQNNIPLSSIGVTISPKLQSVNEMTISVTLEESSDQTKFEGKLTLQFVGLFPYSCPPVEVCWQQPDQGSGPPATVMSGRINANEPTEQFHIRISISRLGLATNGESAIVELPEVFEDGQEEHGSYLSVSYNAPGATTYDWSIPTGYPSTASVGWQEPLTPSSGPGFQPIFLPTEITGTNLQVQGRDERNILIAGILFGVAGSAVVAAIQEGLNMLFGERTSRINPTSGTVPNPST
jgi:hypothetical protein